jgi:4-hydroxy-3-methylbut-2-enyl diphosphate reductase
MRHAPRADKVDGRAVRRSLNKTGRYVRKPNKDPKSNQLMEDHGVGYSSTGLVAQMREQDNVWKQGDVSVKLAKAYGYCWGVERAVRMAYEARNSFPDKRVHITNEIIHNPEVNQVRRGVWGRGGGRGGGGFCVTSGIVGHADCSSGWRRGRN